MRYFSTDDQHMKQNDMEILAVKSQTHDQMLQKEAQEVSEMQEAITGVTAQRDARITIRNRIKQHIAETQKAINQRLEAQRAHADQLDAQAQLNEPELDFWQDYLCVRMEGAGKDDRLKIIFTHLVERDWEKEAYFELDAGSHDYQVLHCRPKLEKEAVEHELEIVNDDRNFSAFLKRMRKLFVEALK
jgi:kinetochore protein Spc25